MKIKAGKLWVLWILSSVAGAALLITGMVYGGPLRAYLLIGKTTGGHHQIELSCTTCHTTPFAGKDEIEKTCLGCHEKELKAADDSHPAKKFRNPRNADRLEKLAANKCITCHTEHKPKITNAIAVTLPENYCALCHKDVGKNRPSHKDLDFKTCASAGCHNYHDNKALYEDFLEKHAKAPELKEKPIFKLRAEKIEIEAVGDPLKTAEVADAPAKYKSNQKAIDDWLKSKHSNAGVNCSGCHAPNQKTPEKIAANWTEKPDHQVCSTCHAQETKTWLSGKHGMRLAPSVYLEKAGLYGIFQDKKLPPMKPELARLPMHAAAGHKELSCSSCHSAHEYNTQKAQVESCVSCHSDDHTQAYLKSKHHELWKAEVAGTGEKGSGVSCATCHMPRRWVEDEGGYDEVLIADHNQNYNLRPNEKMIRSVCMNCHGLGFAIDALADKELIKKNFTGRPSKHVESIDWVVNRLKERANK